MTHERFALANTVSEIEIPIRVDEAHPVVTPPIAEHLWVVIPKDLKMCPVHLLQAGQQVTWDLHHTKTCQRKGFEIVLQMKSRQPADLHLFDFEIRLARLGCK